MFKFLEILIIAFLLFGVLRRLLVGSFYSAMQKHQKEQERKEEKERRRKREGRITIERVQPGQLSNDQSEYVDYEEIN